MANRGANSLWVGSFDWVSVLIYLALVLIGWVNIYAAVYDDAHASILDMDQLYGMQIIWIGISLAMGLAIMLIDDKYYHMLSYPLFWVSILVLIAVMFVGKEVKGAKSWIMLGPIALQPTEFVKFTTALALARCMSVYNFSLTKAKDLFKVGMILMVPFAIILLQNDTGSALVYGAFMFVLYREGLNGWIYISMFMVLLLFVFSFLVTPLSLLVALILICSIVEGINNGHWKSKVIYLAWVALLTMAIYFASNLWLKYDMSVYTSLLVSSIASVSIVIIYGYRRKIRNIYIYIGLFLGSVAFTSAIDYVFDNILQQHQQKRILDLFGLENDIKGIGYNVNQSMIAIGSGGLFGKGFLNGTQTKYNFVPEQSTDFIFCTIGEEWGFLGCLIVVALFGTLIYRLMRMGERQMEAFGRIYCYCIAAIFFVHVMINIGMTIGLLPVIGIPLPFFSYGGSSMTAFSLMFFVAVKMDSMKRELSTYNYI